MVAYLIVLGLVFFLLILRLVTANEIKKQQERLRNVDNEFADLSIELDCLEEEIHCIRLASRQCQLRRSRLTGDIEQMRSKLKNLNDTKDRRVAA